MCRAAWAAAHTKKTFLAAFYRRMSIRKGAAKANVALAHHMIVVVYNVIDRHEEYVEFGADYYDRRNKPKTVARLVKRLRGLGYEVGLREVPATAVIPVLAVDAEPAVPKRRRGRPCKCKERGIPCQHQTAVQANSLTEQASPPA